MPCNAGGCPPGYQMGIPLVTDTDWKRFDNCGDDICDDGCDFDDSDPDIITRPCCANGCCKHCATIGGDAPYLVPKAIACGRTRRRSATFTGLLEDLDEMPGRGDHTILCVRARGIARIYEQSGVGADDMYNIYMTVEIPIEIVLKDCCGFIYTVKSTIRSDNYGGGDGTNPVNIMIPLGFSKEHLCYGDSFFYVKVKVRLCEQIEEATTSSEITLNTLVEACVVKFIPYGIVGDPSARFGPYFCA